MSDSRKPNEQKKPNDPNQENPHLPPDNSTNDNNVEVDNKKPKNTSIENY